MSLKTRRILVFTLFGIADLIIILVSNGWSIVDWLKLALFLGSAGFVATVLTDAISYCKVIIRPGTAFVTLAIMVATPTIIAGSYLIDRNLLLGNQTAVMLGVIFIVGAIMPLVAGNGPAD